MVYSKEDKAFILRQIDERKYTLFDKFSQNITKEKKMECWREVWEAARAFGIIFPNGKCYLFLRDSWWPNIRVGTMQKVDKLNKTGAEGGKENMLNSLDHAVLDIIGKTSAAVNGLPVAETWSTPPPSSDPIPTVHSSNPIPTATAGASYDPTTSLKPSLATPYGGTSRKRKSVHTINGNDILHSTKEEKMSS